jgi:hypothetical protein
MTWQLPDTYHSAGSGRGTATFKFYEGRDILLGSARCVSAWHYVVGGEIGVAPQGEILEEPAEGEGEQGDERADQEDGVE